MPHFSFHFRLGEWNDLRSASHISQNYDFMQTHLIKEKTCIFSEENLTFTTQSSYCKRQRLLNASIIASHEILNGIWDD